jgi:hypothetical protein
MTGVMPMFTVFPFLLNSLPKLSAINCRHHLPRESKSTREISHILKDGAFLYLTREPNLHKFSRFSHFLERAVLKRLLKPVRHQIPQTELPLRLPHWSVIIERHAIHGFYVARLTEFLRSRHLRIVFVYSYHWIFPDSRNGLLQELLSRSDFVIGRIPLSDKLGKP